MRPATLPPSVPFMPAVALKFRGLACQQCRPGGLCLACGLREESLHLLDTVLFPIHRVRRGEYAYHQGQEFHYLHVVRSGTLKTTMGLRNGRDQVSGFHMAGEILGLEDLAMRRHASTAVAIEDSQTCVIEPAELDALAARDPDVNDAMSQLLSRIIVREHGMMVLLAATSAEARLTMFLLNISRKLEARGYAACDFHLRMSRAEIGSHIGVTLETVSRTFSSLQARKLLQVNGRHVRIADCRR
jgi:CRP/FNR family transcriptional regulator, anaerobic regulatory protein